MTTKNKRDNLGKGFEERFKKDFSKIEGMTIDRLKDPGFKSKGVRNICDFIAYKYPNIFYLECKSVVGNYFSLSKLTQYEDLMSKTNVYGAIIGVVV